MRPGAIGTIRLGCQGTKPEGAWDDIRTSILGLPAGRLGRLLAGLLEGSLDRLLEGLLEGLLEDLLAGWHEGWLEGWLAGLYEGSWWCWGCMKGEARGRVSEVSDPAAVLIGRPRPGAGLSQPGLRPRLEAGLGAGLGVEVTSSSGMARGSLVGTVPLKSSKGMLAKGGMLQSS